MLQRAGMTSVEDVFEIKDGLNKIAVYPQKINSFFNRFGFKADANNINIDDEDLIISIPIESLIYKGSFSAKAWDKLKEELESHSFVEAIDYNMNSGIFTIEFTLPLEIYHPFA